MITLDQMHRYIKKTPPISEYYEMTIDEIIALREITDIYDLLRTSFLYGRAKGYRAAIRARRPAATKKQSPVSISYIMGNTEPNPVRARLFFYVASVLGYVLGSCLLITQTPANYFLGLAFVAIAFFMASEMSESFTAAPYPPNRRQSVPLHCRRCSMPPSLYRDMHPRL